MADDQEEETEYSYTFREDEEMEFYTELALHEVERWIQAVTKKSLQYPDDTRKSLENGVLLCELLNCLQPGSVGRINRLPTPIAGLDNVHVFLQACKAKFGLSDVHLFNPSDLEDLSQRAIAESAYLAHEYEKRLRNVAITIYWLGRYTNRHNQGAQLDLSAFSALIHHRQESDINEQSNHVERTYTTGASSSNSSEDTPSKTCNVTFGRPFALEFPNESLEETVSDVYSNMSSNCYNTTQAPKGHDQPHIPHSSIPGSHRRYSSTDSLESSHCSGQSGHSRQGSEQQEAIYPTRRLSSQLSRKQSTSNDPLQFIKSKGAQNLAHTAEVQMRVASESKKGSILTQDSEENVDWQANLSSWKNRRKSQSERSYQSSGDLEQNDKQDEVSTVSRNKTFSQMQKERQHRMTSRQQFYPIQDDDTIQSSTGDKQHENDLDLMPNLEDQLDFSHVVYPDDSKVSQRNTSLNNYSLYSDGQEDTNNNYNSELKSHGNAHTWKPVSMSYADTIFNDGSTVNSARKDVYENGMRHWKSEDVSTTMLGEASSRNQNTAIEDNLQLANTSKNEALFSSTAIDCASKRQPFTDQIKETWTEKKSNQVQAALPVTFNRNVGSRTQTKIGSILQNLEDSSSQKTLPKLGYSEKIDLSARRSMFENAGETNFRNVVSYGSEDNTQTNTVNGSPLPDAPQSADSVIAILPPISIQSTRHSAQDGSSTKNIDQGYIRKTVTISQRPNSERGFGFVLSGGAGKLSALYISKIVLGSAADVCELKVGDVVEFINQTDVTAMTAIEVGDIVARAVDAGNIEVQILREMTEDDSEDFISSDDEEDKYSQNYRGLQKQEIQPVQAQDSRGDRDFPTVQARDSRGDRDFQPVQARDSRGDRDFQTVQARDSRGDREFQPVQTRDSRGDRDFQTVQVQDSRGDRDFQPVQARDSRGDRDFQTVQVQDSRGDRDFQPVQAQDSRDGQKNKDGQFGYEPPAILRKWQQQQHTSEIKIDNSDIYSPINLRELPAQQDSDVLIKDHYATQENIGAPHSWRGHVTESTVQQEVQDEFRVKDNVKLLEERRAERRARILQSTALAAPLSTQPMLEAKCEGNQEPNVPWSSVATTTTSNQQLLPSGFQRADLSLDAWNSKPELEKVTPGGVQVKHNYQANPDTEAIAPFKEERERILVEELMKLKEETRKAEEELKSREKQDKRRLQEEEEQLQKQKELLRLEREKFLQEKEEFKKLQEQLLQQQQDIAEQPYQIGASDNSNQQSLKINFDPNSFQPISQQVHKQTAFFNSGLHNSQSQQSEQPKHTSIFQPIPVHPSSRLEPALSQTTHLPVHSSTRLEPALSKTTHLPVHPSTRLEPALSQKTHLPVHPSTRLEPALSQTTHLPVHPSTRLEPALSQTTHLPVHPSTRLEPALSQTTHLPVHPSARLEPAPSQTTHLPVHPSTRLEPALSQTTHLPVHPSTRLEPAPSQTTHLPVHPSTRLEPMLSQTTNLPVQPSTRLKPAHSQKKTFTSELCSQPQSEGFRYNGNQTTRKNEIQTAKMDDIKIATRDDTKEVPIGDFQELNPPIIREAPTKEEIHSLNSVPKARFRSDADWQSSEKSMSSQQPRENTYKLSLLQDKGGSKLFLTGPGDHWLIQEAERRRIAELEGKLQSGKSVGSRQPVYGPIKPAVDSPNHWQGHTDFTHNRLPSTGKIKIAASNPAAFNPAASNPAAKQQTLLQQSTSIYGSHDQGSQSPMRSPNFSYEDKSFGQTDSPSKDVSYGQAQTSQALKQQSHQQQSYQQQTHQQQSHQQQSHQQQTHQQQTHQQQSHQQQTHQQQSHQQQWQHSPHLESVNKQTSDRSSSLAPTEQHKMQMTGSQLCSHCAQELGYGAAMVIESLGLFFHVQCFRCWVCYASLGAGDHGADVRVRINKLHCPNCYSNDEAGLKFSKV